MSHNISIKGKHVGASVKLTILIYADRNSFEKLSECVNINDLASVQFCTIHDGYHSLKCQIKIQKRLKDSAVKVKVFSEEFKYLSERICPEEGLWDFMGYRSCNTAINSYEKTYLFHVTISAYKIDSAFEKLYKETDFTDFMLSTTEGSVKVHKACLVVHSEFFKKMFNNDCKETVEGSMLVPGVTLKTLQDLKAFIYLGTLPDADLLPLLEMASCYLIKDLKERCVSKLAFSVKPEDWYGLLQHSMENKIPELTFALNQMTPEDVVEKAREINTNVSGQPEVEYLY